MDQSRLSHFKFFLLLLTGVAFALATTCAGSAVLAQSAAMIVAIAKMDVGAPPADFDFARTGQGKPGQWTVASDPLASGGRAIEQSSADRIDYRFPLAIYRSFSAKNVEVSIRFKPISGNVDRAGGVAVRLIDPENYYVVRANALENNVRFYRVVKGSREQIDGANVRVSTNEWHTLGLKADGDRFTVTFDGRQLFTATDRTFISAGRFALWTKSDSITRFDQIEVKALP